MDLLTAILVFLKMAHLLIAEDTKPSEIEPLPFSEYLKVLQPYANCLNLIRAAVNYVKLDDVDPKSERPHMLFVRIRNSRKILSLKELAQQFSQYGSVDIKMMHKRQALVAVTNHRSYRDILEAFHRHPTLIIVRYNPWKHSPFIRALMWCGVFMFGSLSLWTVYSGIRIT
ncbi:hypothetical protein LSH36_44g17030 [Paralvinella palmiformis]|uniref:Uncharacterized protein n=1 Tax=Paralvinella palmiformis TaxID=53620 RepID=A0AAD9K6N8_9ANNE|nr:hypothetical protein LSH36_44g17030 [Paralvinella palmiformis]